MKLGQPPRSKGKGFDQHEQEVWHDQIYRVINQLVDGATTPVDNGTTPVPENPIIGGGSVTINNYNSKRYLRWMQI